MSNYALFNEYVEIRFLYCRAVIDCITNYDAGRAFDLLNLGDHMLQVNVVVPVYYNRDELYGAIRSHMTLLQHKIFFMSN